MFCLIVFVLFFVSFLGQGRFFSGCFLVWLVGCLLVCEVKFVGKKQRKEQRDKGRKKERKKDRTKERK